MSRLHHNGIPPRAHPNPLYLNPDKLLNPRNVFSRILRQIVPRPHLLMQRMSI